MVIIYSERIKSGFKGTIIDIETIGEFNRGYPDSREYATLTPVIFGLIDGEHLEICCARNRESLNKLQDKIREKVSSLSSPLYAFNSIFERGVLYHSCGLSIPFDGELNLERYERKQYARISLDIDNYNDPFNDNGYLCSSAWSEECRLAIDMNSRQSIKHNRSCLLKERDILLKRGYRTPDGLILFR
jgi:hypothetical protein